MIIEVASDSTARQIIEKSVSKMMMHNVKFVPGEYTLHYPDGREVITLPENSHVPFTLSGYRRELMKDYSKLSLYMKLMESEDG